MTHIYCLRIKNRLPENTERGECSVPECQLMSQVDRFSIAHCEFQCFHQAEIDEANRDCEMPISLDPGGDCHIVQVLFEGERIREAIVDTRWAFAARLVRHIWGEMLEKAWKNELLRVYRRICLLVFSFVFSLSFLRILGNGVVLILVSIGENSLTDLRIRRPPMFLPFKFLSLVFFF